MVLSILCINELMSVQDNSIRCIVMSYNEMVTIMYFQLLYIRPMDVEIIIVDPIVVRRMNKNAKILIIGKKLFILLQH